MNDDNDFVDTKHDDDFERKFDRMTWILAIVALALYAVGVTIIKLFF